MPPPFPSSWSLFQLPSSLFLSSPLSSLLFNFKPSLSSYLSYAVLWRSFAITSKTKARGPSTPHKELSLSLPPFSSILPLEVTPHSPLFLFSLSLPPFCSLFFPTLSHTHTHTHSFPPGDPAPRHPRTSHGHLRPFFSSLPTVPWSGLRTPLPRPLLSCGEGVSCWEQADPQWADIWYHSRVQCTDEEGGCLMDATLREIWGGFFWFFSMAIVRRLIFGCYSHWLLIHIHTPTHTWYTHYTHSSVHTTPSLSSCPGKRRKEFCVSE